MNILDRFSTHLRDVLAKSIQLATELKNPEVEPIHLFFCLSVQKGSVAAEIMNRFKISTKTIEQALISLPSIRELSAARAEAAPVRTLTPLSGASKAALERAILIVEEHRHNYIGTEHLLAALVRWENPLVHDVLKASAVKIDELERQMQIVLGNASQFPALSEVGEVIDRLQDHLGDMIGEAHDHPPEPRPARAPKKKKETALDFFGTELTSPEAQKRIDPVIGRDTEIERVVQILSRRTKNNPLLLGDPGVGKTAIVEGLAKRIVEGKVPEMLLNKKIYALDMGLLIAGTIYRGEFEARLRQVIEEVTGNPDIILFIDEIHNIVGAGSSQGTMDAANILKPALARGQIRCIGATTPGEFKKYIENDAALERRFQPIYVKAPSLADTIAILQGIKSNYEAYHNVIITDEAVAAAARLSDRYIAQKFLPDKAIDLLDETAAAARLAAKAPPVTAKLWRLKRELEKAIAAKEAAARSDNFMAAVALKQREEKLHGDIKAAEKNQNAKRRQPVGTVTARDVAGQVAKIVGTVPSDLILEQTDELDTLSARVKEHIVGQDQVVDQAVQLIRQAKLGLSNPDRPLASFLFVGESGVGKTELAKALALCLYHSKDALIKLDMSEFNESFSVSKLVGSPAGYIGYRDSNQFTDRVKLNPYSVILFDEIDKAHKDVAKLLLQMLENGEITDASGKHISLRQTIIILTTSLGAEEVKRGGIGFGSTAVRREETGQRVEEKLKEYFSPELINRLDKICLFEPLTAATLVKIAELELKRFNERLAEYRTALSSDDAILQWIVDQLPSKTSDAREVRRFVRNQIESLMSPIVLQNKLKQNYQLTLAGERLMIK